MWDLLFNKYVLAVIAVIILMIIWYISGARQEKMGKKSGKNAKASKNRKAGKSGKTKQTGNNDVEINSDDISEEDVVDEPDADADNDTQRDAQELYNLVHDSLCKGMQAQDFKEQTGDLADDNIFIELKQLYNHHRKEKRDPNTSIKVSDYVRIMNEDSK